MLCSAPALNAMASMLRRERDNREPRNNVVDVVLRLLGREANERPLAKNASLLPDFTEVCRKMCHAGEERGEEGKRALLKLIPLL